MEHIDVKYRKFIKCDELGEEFIVKNYFVRLLNS